MTSALSRTIRKLRNVSFPFLSHYWTSIWRDQSDAIPLPTRTYGGHAILRRIRDDHNKLVAIFAAFTCAATLRIMDRVEQNVFSGKVDPKQVAEAFIRDFNMLAVTAALIAQLSITALALPILSSVHWACKAGLVGSLGFGILTAWFSSNMARNLSSMDTQEDVKDWLSKPSGRKEQEAFCRSYSSRFTDICSTSEETKEIAKKQLITFINENKWKQASFYSCFMLSLPSVLLNCSIAALVVAIAVYLGDVWGSHLDSVAGDVASRAVLICYTSCIGCALLLFFGCSDRKDAELGFLRKLTLDFEVDLSAQEINSTDTEDGVVSKSSRT
ncbi:hypothetical protein BDV96DRAFT_647614 [Lophiotrema nucula]|uniref:Uncharacterized protein n=1 Tax=Lophiotrema nucula TaxID=690887 RepID=A0A6A5Z549_9PLEO|nr:hypothetical protein BDV96DRAFT_647614 [Lophiotrema nucula]